MWYQHTVNALNLKMPSRQALLWTLSCPTLLRHTWFKLAVRYQASEEPHSHCSFDWNPHRTGGQCGTADVEVSRKSQDCDVLVEHLWKSAQQSMSASSGNTHPSMWVSPQQHKHQADGFSERQIIGDLKRSSSSLIDSSLEAGPCRQFPCRVLSIVDINVALK